MVVVGLAEEVVSILQAVIWFYTLKSHIEFLNNSIVNFVKVVFLAWCSIPSGTIGLPLSQN